MAATTVLFFAESREIVGKTEEHVRLDTSFSSGKQLLIDLCLRFKYGSQVSISAIFTQNRLTSLESSCMLALNEEYVDLDAPLTLKDGDVIAFIPPINGG